MMIVRSGAKCLALFACVAALAATMAATASADEWSRFDQCPSTTEGVFKCLYSLTEGGEVGLGSKSVPIVNPVTLQGGYSKSVSGVSTFTAAKNGVTLSKTPQPVPGGLLGIVPPENSPWIVKQLSKFFFENGLTGVNATLELARPASEITVSEFSLIFSSGTALKLPVKVHLENPFLGSHCYVGSSSDPIIWNLTTGTTSPPSPNEPITGSPGTAEVKEEAQILQLNGTKFVDNVWSAPHASGCGGILSFLVDPIVDATVGVPAAAGHNTAILETTNDIATASAVNEH